MVNEYYDAEKAHEYYEKHKKLKGRHSTKGFSTRQKEMWMYGKAQLTNEKKANTKSVTEDTRSQ